MAENHCGALALEALTCISRALSRLEVGELGVVAFGTTDGVRTLHPLGAPFTDASGPALLSSFSFRGDNTVVDEPAGRLLDALDGQLAMAREHHRGGGDTLQQLVLVIAGEFPSASWATNCSDWKCLCRWPLPREGVAATTRAPPRTAAWFTASLHCARQPRSVAA